MADTIIKVENAGKKFSKSLKHLMLYGLQDIGRNVLGMEAFTGKTRDGEFWAVEDIYFELTRGETLGIIGPNGSGKTTLLQMLGGIFLPDKGKISVEGKVGSLIQVGAGFHPMLTGRENIYINGAILGMKKKEIDRKFDSIVDFADIGAFLDAPVKHYSSGMYVRLGFAVAAHSDPDILLMDEILAVGDYGFQLKCLNKLGELRGKGITTVLVSHNMHMISVFTEKLVLLNKGKAKYFNDVWDGVEEYTSLFDKTVNQDVEKICSGSEDIRFFDVEMNKTLEPGGAFSISMKYESSIDYDDVEVDTAIVSNNDPFPYFQATNKTYNRMLGLKKGKHSLKATVKNININNATATVSFAIWTSRRTQLLFWWRMPVIFSGVDYCTGKNFFNVSYETGD